MKYKNILLTIAVIAILVSAGVYIGRIQVSASAPSGLASTIATSSTMAIGPGNSTKLFDKNPQCNSRVVTTVAKPIMLSFGEVPPYSIASTTVSAIRGHLQLASTTVAYDSGLYGCGLVYAVGLDATTTISLSEF